MPRHRSDVYPGRVFIRVDFDALVSEGVRLDEASDDLDARVRQVRERVEDLLAAGWTGDAASAFRPLFDAWLTSATGSTEELSRLIAALRGATADIAAAEQASSDAARTLESNLPVGGQR